jgi:hypothetical protein
MLSSRSRAPRITPRKRRATANLTKEEEESHHETHESHERREKTEITTEHTEDTERRKRKREEQKEEEMESGENRRSPKGFVAAIVRSLSGRAGTGQW